MKIKTGQYINALKKLSNQHKLNPFFFYPIKLSVILSVTDFYFVSFQSTTPPWLLPMYIYTNVYYGPTLMLLRDIFMHVVLIKNTLWPQELESLLLYRRRSMSLKSWKNLEDRLYT